VTRPLLRGHYQTLEPTVYQCTYIIVPRT